MTDTLPADHQIGANNPPTPIDFVDTALKPLEEFGLPKVKTRIADLVRNANLWKTKVPEIKDVETAKACQTFIDQLTEEFDALEMTRVEEKKPFDEGAAKVQATFKPGLELLKAAKEAMVLLRRVWLLAEQRRVDAENARLAKIARDAELEAERLRKLAEAPDAAVEDIVAANQAIDTAAAVSSQAAAAPTKARVTGSYGSRASGLRSSWSATITDWSAAAAGMSSDAKVRDAVQSAANRKAVAEKANMDVPWGRAVEEKV